MTTGAHPHPPAPPEAVARVQDALRGSWWQTTLLMSVPLVVAVLLGYVVVLQVLEGDWLALLFPGVVVLACAWMFARVAGQAFRTHRMEAALSQDDRQQAIYVRGLSGTHVIAAAQDPAGFAVLDGLWRREQGEVLDVRSVGTQRRREILAVDVQLASGRVVPARLAAEQDHRPSVGTTVRILQDPHHPRAVVDLRPVP